MENPSLFSSYLGGTNNNCDKKSTWTGTLSQQMLHRAHTQLQTLEEPIFERPLDPYMQENSASNLPTNAKMSIVTSDSNFIREQNQAGNCFMTDQLDHFAMSRMNWLWALRPLFDSLKAFHN